MYHLPRLFIQGIEVRPVPHCLLATVPFSCSLYYPQLSALAALLAPWITPPDTLIGPGENLTMEPIPSGAGGGRTPGTEKGSEDAHCSQSHKIFHKPF